MADPRLPRSVRTTAVPAAGIRRRPHGLAWWLAAVAGVLLATSLPACDSQDGADELERGERALLDAGPGDASAPAAPAAEVPPDSPLVVFLGDSLAAGLHLPADLAYPAVLQRRLAGDGLPFRLVNAGVSGDTTAGGLARIDWLLEQDPDVVVVALGGNDGLRGRPVEAIASNLERIVERVREAGARPVLAGMRMPPNYGGDYTSAFEAIFRDVAEESGAAFVPHLLEGVGGDPTLNLPDGIHPTAEGHERVADNVEPVLRRVLAELAEA